MAKQLQLRRGTTIQNEAFTGAVGELTMDTDKKQLRLHDGVTQGGAGIVDPVVETYRNGTDWYRKYASGWVEQGGIVTTGSSGNHTVTLLVEMKDIQYLPMVTRRSGASTTTNVNVWSRTPTSTTEFILYSSDDTGAIWRVEGMAA